jgi:hypothetical protein
LKRPSKDNVIHFLELQTNLKPYMKINLDYTYAVDLYSHAENIYSSFKDSLGILKKVLSDLQPEMLEPPDFNRLGDLALSIPFYQQGTNNACLIFNPQSPTCEIIDQFQSFWKQLPMQDQKTMADIARGIRINYSIKDHQAFKCAELPCSLLSGSMTVAQAKRLFLQTIRKISALPQFNSWLDAAILNPDLAAQYEHLPPFLPPGEEATFEANWKW